MRDKGTVETSFNAVDTLFAQYVAGYVGNSVENRGKDAGQAAAWSLLELQELLDEWLVATWANRPHDGLRDPLTPGRALTPNEKYAALVEVAGYMPVPLSQNDYIELLPVEWRAINSYGVKIRHRKYDSKALRRYSREHSGVTARKGLWEVHRDPYDVTRIWVRNHHHGGWIEAIWTYLNSGPAPFGDLAWDHAQQILARRGIDKPTEDQIARAASDLLDRAEQGPGTDKRDLRVAARARSTSSPASPPLAPSLAAEGPDDIEDEDEDLAKVIPLGVFDAAEEAKKWW
jgi:hypothetical protein